MLRQERAPKLLEQLRGAALALKKTALPKSTQLLLVISMFLAHSQCLRPKRLIDSRCHHSNGKSPAARN